MIEVTTTKFEIERFYKINFPLLNKKITSGMRWTGMLKNLRFEGFYETNFPLLSKTNCLAIISGRSTKITNDNKWNEMDGNAIKKSLHLALADKVLSSMEERKLQRSHKNV